MSGFEIAGVILAVLPLVANQLDNYTRGIATIKGLRQYRWELENYSSKPKCAVRDFPEHSTDIPSRRS